MAASHWFALSVAEIVATERKYILKPVDMLVEGLTENAEDDSLEGEPEPGKENYCKSNSAILAL